MTWNDPQPRRGPAQRYVLSSATLSTKWRHRPRRMGLLVAQLIAVATGGHLWAERYDTEFCDLSGALRAIGRVSLWAHFGPQARSESQSAKRGIADIASGLPPNRFMSTRPSVLIGTAMSKTLSIT
jgi:hypothetical protein